MLKKTIGHIHRILAKNSFSVKLAVKMQNQTQAVIKSSLNDGIELNENGEGWLIKKVAPHSSVFIDVGANVGSWSKAFLDFAKKNQLGILFEPAAETLEILRKNMNNYECRHDLRIINMAASDADGESDFFEEKNYGETSSLIAQHSEKDAKKITIKTITIDQFIKENNIEHIDILKIDAEGFDLKVIKGAKRGLELKLIDIVQFEYNAPWVYTGSTLYEALQIMSRADYKTFLLKKNGLQDFDYRVHGEFYGYANFVSISANALSKYFINN